jgi:agmatine deiminase
MHDHCATLLLAAWLTGCTQVPPARDPAAFRQPAEFEPQAAIWMSADPEDPEFMHVTAELAQALHGHVRVRMMLEDSTTLEKTRDLLRQSGVALDSIEFSIDPLATYFLRDGTVYLVNGRGERAVLDFKWSEYGLPGWCQRVYADNPEAAARCATYVKTEQDALDLSFARSWNAAVIPSTLFLENAAIEVNGQGVLLISEPLALERNPGRSRAELEAALLQIPGIRKVVWLAEGLVQDPQEKSTIEGAYVGIGAGGHTDEFVRFADASTILLAWVGDAQLDLHPLNRINRERMQRNREILAAATDQAGQPFRIVEVPMPAVIERKVVLAPKTDRNAQWNELYFPKSEGRKAGDELIQVASASYLNLVIANDLVLVPSFVEDGTPEALQAEVRGILQGAFPGRTIQFIHATPLSWNGGGPHCATLSEPRAH